VGDEDLIGKRKTHNVSARKGIERAAHTAGPPKAPIQGLSIEHVHMPKEALRGLSAEDLWAGNGGANKVIKPLRAY
jgi:hypothetical protein